MIQTNELDNFIKSFSKLYAENPNVTITPKTMYRSLALYNVDENEQMRNIKDQIDALKKEFEYSLVFEVFRDQDNKSFLFFSNWPRQNKQCMKLYLNIPKDYVETVSKKILYFLEDNRIVNDSKVCQFVRADGFVMRISNQKDVESILNFINNDPEIRAVAKKTNPFLIRDGVVGISYDGKSDSLLSFNSIVAECLSNYFNKLKSENMISKASLQDFADYMQKLYHDTFISCTNLVNYSNENSFKESLKYVSSFGDEIVEHERIIRLLTLISNGQIDKNNFYNFYQECYDADYNDYFKKASKMYDETYRKNLSCSNEKDNYFVNIREILDSYIKFLFDKNNNIQEVIKNIDCLLFQDRSVYLDNITTENGFRTLFKYVDRSILLNIVRSNIEGYVKSVIERKNTNELSKEEQYDLFIKACQDIALKSNFYKLVTAIENAKKGNFENFTNDEQKYREQLKEKINPDYIVDFCIEYLFKVGYDPLDMNTVKMSRTMAEDMTSKVEDKIEMAQVR